MLDFLGLGAQKSGTTWLFENLSLHPGVSFPGGKEVHFWNRRKSLGLTWYRGIFDVADGRLHGDITPAYAILPASVIAECHRAFPGLRLIYLLRNPIDRALSHAAMDARNAGLDPGSLPDQWYRDHVRSVASRVRGDYEACIKNWLSVYPEERLLLALFDELRDEPAALIGKCCRHLGLEEGTPGDGRLLAERINPGPPQGVNPGLRAVLHELYDEPIASLARFLGRDLSPWLAEPGAPAAADPGRAMTHPAPAARSSASSAPPGLAALVALQRSGSNMVRGILASAPSLVPYPEVFERHPSGARAPTRMFWDFLLEQVRDDPRAALPQNRPGLVGRYFAEVASAHPGRVPVLDIKFHSLHHAEGLWSRPGAPPRMTRLLRERNDAVILLTRRNTLRMIVSRTRALALGRHHAAKPGDVPRERLTLPVAGLVEHVRLRQDNQEAMQELFAGHPRVVRLTYEDLWADVPGGRLRPEPFAAVAACLGVEPAFALRPTLVKFTPNDLRAVLENFDEVADALRGTGVEWMLEEP